MLEALILAGGLGTRLTPVVPHLPKALAPVQGVPFLELLLQQLQSARLFSKVILALGHKAEMIQHYLQKKTYAFETAFSFESSPKGTGGAILQALSQIQGEIFCALNGDSYSDLSFSDFWHFHQKKRGAASIACHRVDDIRRYGSVEFDEECRIVQFSEKARGEGWVSRGVYFLQKRLFAPFAPGCYSLEYEFFPSFVEKGMFAYLHPGDFIDIGIPDAYRKAQECLKPWVQLR